MYQGNDFSPVAPVYTEVRQIRRNNGVPRIQFAHPNDTQVGKIRLAIPVSAREFFEARDVFRNIEDRFNQPRPDELQNQPCVSEMKCGLGQNRFTRQEWIVNLVCESDGPVVVLISPVSESDKEAGIGDTLHLLEKPFRDERSAGPDTFPARRRNGRVSTCRAFSSCSRMIFPWDTPVLAAVASSHSARSSGRRMVSVLRICPECKTLCTDCLLSPNERRLS